MNEGQEVINEQQLNIVIAGIRSALERNPYGKIILELRGPDRPIDMVIESRTRFPTPEPVPVERQGKTRVIRKDR